MKKILLLLLLATLSFSAMADDDMYCYRKCVGQKEYFETKVDGIISYFVITRNSDNSISRVSYNKNEWKYFEMSSISEQLNLTHDELVSFVNTGKLPNRYTFYIDRENFNTKLTDSYITIRPIQDITSSTVSEGSTNTYFEVANAKDSTLIGKKVVAKVLQARKSNIFGSEGRLVIRPLYIDNDGTLVELLPDDIYARGLNRSNVKFWTSFTVIMLFVPGSGAQITTDKRYDVRLK